MKKIIITIIIVLLLILVGSAVLFTVNPFHWDLPGISFLKDSEEDAAATVDTKSEEAEKEKEKAEEEAKAKAEEEAKAKAEEEAKAKAEAEAEAAAQAEAEAAAQAEAQANASKIIVIDAGHQEYANTDVEPVGPGAEETKIKVSGGTSGVATGIPEYQLTLTLALKLQTELENRGYTVIMVRTSNDVDISNSERAAVANNANADAFIRVHANGSEDSSVCGAMTICQTPDNPYNGALYSQSYALSASVLNNLVAATGCNMEYVWETDTMSGINWCQVPVTIVEVGYMTNPDEDMLLSDDGYQNQIAAGIANGVEEYLNNQ